MSTGNCCGATIKPNIEIPKIITNMNKKETLLKIVELMEHAIMTGGPSLGMNQRQIQDVVKYYNEFYGKNVNQHNMADMKQAVMNSKELYFQYKKGMIKIEEEQPPQPELNLDQLPESSTNEVDDKLTDEEKIIDPAEKDLFFQKDYDNSEPDLKEEQLHELEQQLDIKPKDQFRNSPKRKGKK